VEKAAIGDVPVRNNPLEVHSVRKPVSRELVRFAPGEYQTGYNSGEGRTVGWALGAPGARHDWDELESIVDCRECGKETGHATTLTDEGRFELTCNGCGTSFAL
jgi:hypothetical protein